MGERKDNLEKFNNEKKEPEICLENAELCDSIAKLWATEDREIIYWKKRGLEIREKYYGKGNSELAKYYDDIANEQLECTNYKSSLKMCDKALKIKKQNNCNIADIIKTYTIMMEDYLYLHDYESGIKFGAKVLNADNIIERIEDIEVIEGIADDVSQIIVILSRMYIKINNKKEAEYWLNYGLKLAIGTLGENSVMAADMYSLKATSFLVLKNEKLEFLKKALIIYIDAYGMRNSKSEKTFFWIWRCWEKETDKPINAALEWLEKNLLNNYYIQIKAWRERNLS